MDIQIPPELQWVSYLAGGAWPQGSETRMGRIGEHFATAAGELQDLLPDLNSVRSETISVLAGDTAMAAVNQFAMLFDGDYSVDTLANGVTALGGGANDLSVQIEYSKLSIIVGLALAAAEITWCLANSPETAGASLSWIPAIEWTTMTSIRRLVATVLEKIATKLGQMLEQTTIKDLVHHGIREAFQELGQGLAQEGITQGIQVGQGRAQWRPDLFRQNGIASAVGGAAGGGTALPVGHALGRAESKLGRATKGMTTMFSAGIAGNVAGTAAVGGEFDTLAVIAGSAGSSVGGVKGLGHGGHGDNESNTNHRAEPPAGDPSGLSPEDLASLDEDASLTEPDTDERSSDTEDGDNGERQTVDDTQGASPSAVANNNARVNSAAARSDSAAVPAKGGTDQQSTNDTKRTADDTEHDVTPDAAPKTSHHTDNADDSAANPSKSTTDSETHTVSDPEVRHQTSTNFAAEEPHSPPSQNGEPLEGHTQLPGDQPVAPESRIESTADQPSQAATDTTPHNEADTETASVTHTDNPAPETPVTGTPTTPVGNTTAPPSSTSHPTATGPSAHSATSSSSTPSQATPAPIRAVPDNVSASPTKAASTAEPKGTPVARVSDTVAQGARPTGKDDAELTPVAGPTDEHQSTQTPGTVEPAGERASTRQPNCLPKTAENLTARYAEHGREFAVEPTGSDEGDPARALFEAANSASEFRSYREIKKRLLKLGPGSSAIVASSWAGSGAHMGGHIYLAVNDGGKVYLLDGDVRSGWPPHWGQHSISRVAVGYLDSRGVAVNGLDGSTVHLAAADAVGRVAGHPREGGDPGARWQDVPSQHDHVESALQQRGLTPERIHEIRNPLGSMEAASERAKANTTWWRELNGDQQRALIHEYPEHIGNAEGIPSDARHEANKRALDQRRKELQSWRDRGQRLTRFQRKELARLDRIQQALDTAAEAAGDLGGPRLLAFDSGAFGGDGRAVVSFGEDPYKAQLVAWHVPGQGMTIDQIGPCMGDALNHLQSIRAEDKAVSAATIAWIGYDTPSGLSSWRASGSTLAREGAKILYSDIRAFNTVRDALADDGSHFSANHIFAHSYGSTTASYAGQDGRLANDICTITLAGSPGAGPLQHASEFGIGADNVFVASSSRDPFTAMGGRRPGSLGRIFGRGLGMDPAMHAFGAHRVTAEFSAEMDLRRNRGTHNAYFRFVDRGADPPVRSESLANFGRIASGHADRVDTERHRTVDRQPLGPFGSREGTVEPAVYRPLRLDSDDDAHAGDRTTRRPWNPHWLPHEEPSRVAEAALSDRGISADDLMSPVNHRVPPEDAVARAEVNGHWWRGLSETQQLALIETYPIQIGNSEGIPPMARHQANSIRLREDLARRDLLVDQRASGIPLTDDDEKFIKLMNEIDDAMRTGEAKARKAGVGGPYLLAFDPDAFDGVGRAIVSFGDDPYKAGRVLWYVPGMSTTIEKLRTMMLRGFNTLQSTLEENPTLSVASITYIGYKAPGSWDLAVASPKMAQEGGQIFASDMLSFNAGRDVFAADGSHFSENHVFAHSYGSTTVSYAGHDARLAGEVRTITLIGSPGAGHLQHASDFGIGDNVYVASSSRDATTALGGERPNVRGRIAARYGLGVDPAMETFGAHRITAEFPSALDQFQGTSRMTHSLYWAYMDPGAEPHIRSESLANFGRIAAGRHDRVDIEDHRYLSRKARWIRSGTTERTVDPAIARDLRLPDDPDGHHPAGRRHSWNPLFRRLPHGARPDRPLVESRYATESRHGDAGAVAHVPDSDKALANRLLEDRGVQHARELMSPVDHRVPKRQAVARARENGRWWRSLEPEEQKALIKSYPHEIGNAEGIPPLARHEANSIMLQRHRAHRDVLVSRRDNGVKLNVKQQRFIGLMKEIDDAMRTAEANARKARVGGPYLLALDPRAFKGAGRAIVSFGEDPYTAERVLWYVPGMTTTIDKLHPMMQRAFNQLQSALQVDENLSVASVTYIGYRAPGSWDPNVIFQRLARQGGSIFASDISSFNAGRDAFTGGPHFRGNHIFAHSYGSSTVSHAGHRAQLANEVQTITLIGSPGAGPVHRASEFGIGDNVFVAASSRDKTPGLGGEHAGDRGRVMVRRMGQGMDPAMKAFGARRITAEFPAEVDHSGPGSRMTHSLYWAYHDPGQHHVRSESLTNFGRIAAGRLNEIETERPRYLEQRRGWFRTHERTVDPAIGRRLHLVDDPVTPRSVHGRNIWNPKFLRNNNCGPAAIDALSNRHPGQDFQLVTDRSPKGVHAFRLFEAIRSSSTFATYEEIRIELERLGPGSSALVASRWRGWRAGGHAYLAINDGGTVRLLDTHTGEISGWPPHWGQNAVTRTAVGYLRPDGTAENGLDGSRGQLTAAHSIYRVQGPSDAAVADPLLAQRVPPVGHPSELRHPVDSPEEATARARANATWWEGLSDTHRQELIDRYPEDLGNAEGIRAEHRRAANEIALQNLRERADRIRTRIDEFGHPSATDRKFLDRVDRIDLAVRKATADAAQLGLTPPNILALDVSEVSGRGRLVLSFGEDPYHARKVSWHTATEPVDQFGTVVRPALDQLQADQLETPSAAAVISVGDQPPGALHSDLSAFHATREALAPSEDGTAFTENRVHTVHAASDVDTRPALWVPRDEGSMVVAHRGASHEFPEQTLAAYREALRQGADGLECDIRLTKDGQLVCIHDKRIDRTSNGSGRVRDMTLAELQEFDFGSQHPSHARGDVQGDTGILTLDELLTLVKNHDRHVTLFIEAKEHGGRLERELVALLDRHGLANPPSPEQSRVAVISFYPDAIWRVHRAAPDVPTVLLGSTARHLAAHVGATAIGPSIKSLRAHPEMVDIAARQGLTTYCWTVNDASDVQFARDLGVGWIATDHPGRTGDLVHRDQTTPAAHGANEHQTVTPAADVAERAAVEAHEGRLVADEALRHRIPPVRPDELRNPLGSAEEAGARARNNAAWWERLTDAQKRDLIRTYPHDIGNAEGIPAKSRDQANQLVVRELRDRADDVQSKIDEGQHTTRAERKLLRQVNRLDLALRKAGADAERASVQGPWLLAFDPAEFGGDGRAVLSFGEDPYTAKSVSWHVPGVATTMNSLFGFYAECALNHLQSTLAANPGETSVASIAWIGYDTPSGRNIWRAAGRGLARAGGDLLHSDITAFNSARDAFASDGSHFSANHVFGYSYGSTTTGYAGQNGRLAGEITTVSLVGSPGAGPIRHAGEFGLAPDHVFAASSSRDVVTALGGRTPNSAGRILGIGLGIDPAMDTFGARRIEAEFPPARNQLLTGGTHHGYYLNTDSGSRVRSESLTNLGRIAAGRHEDVTREEHRTADGLRTVEPAAHRSGHRIWNPRWRVDQDGGPTHGTRADPDFVRRQQEYRAQDTDSRHVDTRYADPLADVVDNPTQAKVDRLAGDLSGIYGPHRISLEGEVVNGEVLLTGRIFNGDTEIGTIQRSFYRDTDGKLVAYHSGLVIREEFEGLRGQGFSKVLTSELERYYVHSGVDRIGSHTHDLGGLPLARRGFTWDPDPRAMQRTFDAIKGSADRLRDHVGPEAKAALDDVVRQLDPANPRLPEPIDIASLATPDEPELGRRLLDGLAARQDGTGLDLVKYMPSDASSQPQNGLGARLKRLFGLGGDPRSDQDCAHRLADALSTRYYGRDFSIPVARSHIGTPAWALFEAAGTRAEFARYDEVPDRLRDLGDGSSVILVSRWAGGRGGGHAYLAINDGGDIHLFDPDTGERSAWPPHWGQDAVSHTAAGYLKPDGSPQNALNADPLQQQLADADLVGDVQGRQDDVDFLRRQIDYRDQDLTTRHVDTRYAEPLADVVGDRAYGMAAARRLGDDLSGTYGPYRIRYDEVYKFDNEVRLSGDIYHGDQKIGRSGWIFHRAPDGHLVVTNSGLVIDAEFEHLRGQGFSRSLTSELERYFVHSGVDRIELHTHDKGGYAWPRMDYTWHPGSRELQESLDQVRTSASRLKEEVGPAARAILEDIVARLDPNHPRLPEPSELANLTADGEPELGRRLMEGSSRLNKGLNLVRYLPHDVPSEQTPQSRNGFGARLKRMFGLGEARPAQDCAHSVADELSTIYEAHGRQYRIATARSPMGTPAWALFESVGARTEFADYTEMEARLRELGPGSSAVIASRWAGVRSGGHAYLAVYDGDTVQLYDPETRQRSDWPPHWGQGAVGRTAVGYLDGTGAAVNPLTDVPLQLDLKAADLVGDVRGHPGEPSDFARRQEEYRATDPTTRRVDSRYAEPLRNVVDSASSAAAGRLAEDLSGNYGTNHVQLEGLVVRGRGFAPNGDILEGEQQLVILEGPVHCEGRQVGSMAWTFYRDDDGSLVAHYEAYLEDGNFAGREFTQSLLTELAPHFARADVDRITSAALGRSAYAAADLGDSWDPDPASLQESLANVRASAERLFASVSDEAQQVLNEIVTRLDPTHPRLPEPIELANLATPEEPDLGRRLLEGTEAQDNGTALNYVKYLWNTQLHPAENCGHWAIGRLSERFGREFHIDAEATPAGVPARALFEAIKSRADFHSYREIEELLMQMDPGKPGGPGPAALVVSSWAGSDSQGGHAYLAVYDGGQVYLEDLFTGERLPWPPYWGDDAVSQTAVGFLNADGRPVQTLGGSPDELAAADVIGDVQGHPDDSGLPRVSGSIELHMPSAVAGITGPVRKSVTGLVTGLAHDSRTTPTLTTDESGTARQTASIVLRAVEVRGPTHIQLSEALGDPGLLRIDSDDLTVRCRVQYRIFDSGNIQATIIYADPALNHPNFDTVRRMIDAALQDRFPDKAIEIAEMYDFGDRTDMVDRELPPRDALGAEQPAGPDIQTPGPVRALGLPDYEPASLSDVEAGTVYGHGELRMRELNEQLIRDGVSDEDRARNLFEHRNSLRAWTRDLMSNRTTAEFLAANESNPTFDEMLARQQAKGLTGDAAYEAIIHTATHSPYSPGTLSDTETTAVYGEFEERLRELNARLTDEGVSVEERARKLSDLRRSLRAWTRDLMSNRVAADFLASHESNRSFDELVARNEAKGLVGDAVYEAIIHTAINSHYGLGTLDDFETRTVYTNAELRMRRLNERLIEGGANIEERARIMSALRASVRTWTRELMADRAGAETLHTKEQNPSFDDLVAKQRSRGLEGDAIYQAIIESSTRSRPSVNEMFGIDPDNPPPLPPMRSRG